MQLFVGWILGIAASAIAALALDRASRPQIEIVEYPGRRALGELADGTKLEYHHVLVRNSRTRQWLPSRRPAWACQATLEVFRWTGEPLLSEPIRARWSSTPEPITSYVVGSKLIPAADLTKILTYRKIDIYGHQDERIVLALKHQGLPALYLFSNESYQYEYARNPAWRLDPGAYRLRVSVHYERGMVFKDFELRNAGPNLDDVKLQYWTNGPRAVPN